MKIEIGESAIYSWLKHVKNCQLVTYNWKVDSYLSLCNQNVMENIYREVSDHFLDKYGYNVFKKNANLKQIIKQSECDVLGMAYRDNIQRIYAVDVAYHEGGLNYGSEDETIMKIIAKAVRSAICVCGHLFSNETNVYFASPKVSKTLKDKIEKCFEEINVIFKNNGVNCKANLICNDEFKSNIIEPLIMILPIIKDHNELFMRSIRLLEMFNLISPISLIQNTNLLSSKKYKIGELAKYTIPSLITNGKVSQEEINNMLDKDYSKETFGISLPVLALANSKYERVRYYTDGFTHNGTKYVLCSQWFENSINNDRPLLETWIKNHMI